jgi:hypothetical protein
VKPLALALSACMALGACGGGSDSGSRGATVTEQVTRYFAAIAAGDGQAACDRLARRAQAAFEQVLEGPVSTDCRKNMQMLSRRSVRVGRPRISGVRVADGHASAHISFRRPDFESDVLLVREDGVWKLAYIAVPPERLPGPPGIKSELRDGK